MNNRAYGARGEKEALSYLEKCGYKILNKNFRVGRLGEIDIIGMEKETLCFIEVKTRSSHFFGTPAQAVTQAKQAKITCLANIYMQKYGIKNMPVRFDIAELMMDRDGMVKDIRVIKNAF